MSPFTDVELEILEAAEEHFATDGFHETIVADIADDAGVGKGTVYRHFGHKAELFGTLIERGSDELREALESVRDEQLPLKEAVRSILDVHFDFFEKKQHLMEVVVKEGLARTGDEMEEVLQKFTRYRETLSDILNNTTDSDVTTQLPDELLNQLLLSWMWGLFRDRIIFGLHDDPDVYRESMAEIFVEGLKQYDPTD